MPVTTARDGCRLRVWCAGKAGRRPIAARRGAVHAGWSAPGPAEHHPSPPHRRARRDDRQAPQHAAATSLGPLDSPTARSGQPRLSRLVAIPPSLLGVPAAHPPHGGLGLPARTAGDRPVRPRPSNSCALLPPVPVRQGTGLQVPWPSRSRPPVADPRCAYRRGAIGVAVRAVAESAQRRSRRRKATQPASTTGTDTTSGSTMAATAGPSASMLRSRYQCHGVRARSGARASVRLSRLWTR